MKYIPQSETDQKQILDFLGLETAEEVFNDIPKSLRTKNVLDYPKAQSEIELRRSFRKLAGLSSLPKTSFCGAGIYRHYVPSIVPTLQLRSEFATAYTPYQPEISQGTLQAIFEFQTLACQLTETEISNATLYDGATSLAEGVLMALRLKKRSEGKVLIPSLLHPFYREVIDTYCAPFNDRIETFNCENNQLSIEALKSRLQKGDVDVLVTQSPNVFGVIENYPEIGKLVEGAGCLWVTSTMEPVSWGLLRGPGVYGAHIVTGEGQSFGNAPYLGGSTYGIFCSKKDFVRQLPGRLVGETLDVEGRRSYTLTFSTREQFIRREKATSNICTNHNLNMLAGLIHLASLGKQGIRELALQNYALTEHLKDRIRNETKLKLTEEPTFNEFTLNLPVAASDLVEKATQEGWICGFDLGRWNPTWKSKILIHVNELHNESDFDQMIELFKQI